MLAFVPQKACDQKLMQSLPEVWLAENRDADDKALNVFIGKVISISIPVSMKKLLEDREELLSYHNVLLTYWVSK